MKSSKPLKTSKLLVPRDQITGVIVLAQSVDQRRVLGKAMVVAIDQLENKKTNI